MGGNRPGPRLVHFLPLALVAGLGMFLVWYATFWGAGLISDSFQYTAGARSLASGSGFSLPFGNGELEPMTKYPPMFSILLAGFELAGVPALGGARLVNIILFGVNIFLVFYSTQRLSDSRVFSLLAAVLTAISFVTVEVHSWALSEPLYICLGLTAILLTQNYFEEAKGTWLILAALAASAAFLTRYAGASLVLAIAIILLMNRIGIRQRLRDLVWFGGIAVLPVALWSLRGYLLTRTLNDRTLSYHPLTVKNYVAAIDVLYGWFIPPTLVQGAEKIFLALTAAALVVLSLFLWKFYRGQAGRLIREITPKQQILLLQGLYIILYTLVIVLSKTWIDPDIGLSDRILSPMLVSLIILLAAVLSFLWDNYPRVRFLVGLVAIGLIAYYSSGTFIGIRQFHETGIGIARRGWHRSEVIQSLHSYADVPMYTNSNSSLYLWSDRSGGSIPEFELLKEMGTDTRVLLVVFHHVPPTGKRLDNLTSGLELVDEDQVATIYALAPPPEK